MFGVTFRIAITLAGSCGMSLAVDVMVRGQDLVRTLMESWRFGVSFCGKWEGGERRICFADSDDNTIQDDAVHLKLPVFRAILTCGRPGPAIESATCYTT